MSGRIALIGLLVLAATVAGVVWWTSRPVEPSSTPEDLTEILDTDTLRQTVELSHINIKTSTNYLGHRIYSIHGKLKNISSMPLRLIDVHMTFVDYDNKPVHEAVHEAFEPKWKPLEPGTEYEFSASFENLPKNWNYRIPIAEVSRVAY